MPQKKYLKRRQTYHLHASTHSHSSGDTCNTGEKTFTWIKCALITLCNFMCHGWKYRWGQRCDCQLGHLETQNNHKEELKELSKRKQDGFDKYKL